MNRSRNRVAVITGSATGIGAATAELLAGDNWNVLINYTRSAQEARETAGRCEQQGGETALYAGSVATDEHCRNIVALALRRWGRVDALVNNAGTTKVVPPKNLEDLDAADFERIFSVNLVGAYQMARAAAPALRDSGNGAIVNISSLAAFTGIGSSIAYAASKGALNTMTKSLAIALSPEIRVNAICPDYVDTRWVSSAMSESDYLKFKETVSSRTLLKTMVNARDVAELARFLIAGTSKITGESIVLDAGRHLNNPLAMN